MVSFLEYTTSIACLIKITTMINTLSRKAMAFEVIKEWESLSTHVVIMVAIPLVKW
jgi:hypothetical protein